MEQWSSGAVEQWSRSVVNAVDTRVKTKTVMKLLMLSALTSVQVAWMFEVAVYGDLEMQISTNC